MSDRQLDGVALRRWAHRCVGDLITHTDEINRLNVFPVADADTGTNMLFTMRAAVAEADAVPDDVAAVMAALAAGALRGARGNSGVVLSQILRGISEVTASTAAGAALEVIEAPVLAKALAHSVGTVVAAMGGEVIAGTIVSVLQAAADAAEPAADAGMPQTLAAICDAAATALDRTPDQLDVLAAAGVVDAGGRGLLVLLDALQAVVSGQPAPARPAYRPAETTAAPGGTLVPVPSGRPAGALPAARPPAFEVMYALRGMTAAAEADLRRELEDLGDSVVIAAAGTQPDTEHSVHVHTDDAGAAIEAGLAVGAVSQIRIAALAGHGGEVAPAGWARERAVLAVVDGDEAEELFSSEGAVVLRTTYTAEGPFVSAHQLLRAVIDTGAAKVMVLPNGYLPAEELVAGCTAAIGWGIDVVPLPTGSMVQGLAALAVHDPGRQAVDDGYSMAQAAGAARYGSVRRATEDALTWVGPCHVGDGLGISGGEVLVVRHDIGSAARGLIDLMLAAGGDMVTVLLGAGVEEQVGEHLADHVRRHHLGAELVCYPSGHRGDAVMIGVE